MNKKRCRDWPIFLKKYVASPPCLPQTLSWINFSSLHLFQGGDVAEGVVERRTERVGPRAARERALHR